MDPRRVWELNEAATKGAARRAAAEATQRSIQGALRSDRGDTLAATQLLLRFLELSNKGRAEQRQTDVEMLDAPSLTSSYDLTRTTSSTTQPAHTGLERVLSHSRSGLLSNSTSIGRSLSSDSAFSMAMGSPGKTHQHAHHRPSSSTLNTQATNRRQHSNGPHPCFNPGPTSVPQSQPARIRTMPTASQVIDLDSPLPLHQRTKQSANTGRLRRGGSGTVDLTGASPPIHVAARQPSDRIDLERIGSHNLASTSSGFSDPWLPQNTANVPTNRVQHANRFSDDCGNAVDLADIPFAENNANVAMRSNRSTQRSTRPATDRSSRQPPGQSRQEAGVHGFLPASRARHEAIAAASDTAQQDLDLALAMSLAAEDEEELLRIPAHSSENPYGSRRPRQPYASRPRGSGLRFEESLTDPFAVLHPTRLLRNSHSASHIDSDAAYAMMAALMSDFDEPNGASHIGAGTAGPAQDMSYEALTNLEDVKLTAPPELLATMPLDMCLKGSQWEDKACSVCQCEYELDDVVMILPCEHHFHKDCVTEWLSKHSKKCPICKESIGG